VSSFWATIENAWCLIFQNVSLKEDVKATIQNSTSLICINVESGIQAMNILHAEIMFSNHFDISHFTAMALIYFIVDGFCQEERFQKARNQNGSICC
jgi:hypothetical protein